MMCERKIATKAAIALVALNLGGCAGLLGPGGVVAQNQAMLQNFLLLTATVATTEAAYSQTKAMLEAPAAPKQNQP